jgi:quinoprotein glucose dehydrogenase
LRTLLLMLVAVLPATLSAQSPPAPAEWPAYGADARGSRFSPLSDIMPANVATLRVAWRYSTGEASEGPDPGRPTSFEATPIVVDGTLFFSTPLGRVIALDPET